MLFEQVILAQKENVLRFKLKQEGKFLSFQEVFELWKMSPEFINFYTSLLKSEEYSGLFWEHPPLTLLDLSQEYECIIYRSNSFDKRLVDEQAFQDFIQLDDLAVSFSNLGKNATLIVPTKQIEAASYKHFGVFLEQAKEEQILTLFQEVGKIILEEIKEKERVWLNTSGLGVLWLHIRLDTIPKYYKTKRYKEVDYFK